MLTSTSGLLVYKLCTRRYAIVVWGPDWWLYYRFGVNRLQLLRSRAIITATNSSLFSFLKEPGVICILVNQIMFMHVGKASDGPQAQRLMQLFIINITSGSNLISACLYARDEAVGPKWRDMDYVSILTHSLCMSFAIVWVQVRHHAQVECSDDMDTSTKPFTVGASLASSSNTYLVSELAECFRYTNYLGEN